MQPLLKLLVTNKGVEILRKKDGRFALHYKCQLLNAVPGLGQKELQYVTRFITCQNA